jgi:hypothetical protein
MANRLEHKKYCKLIGNNESIEKYENHYNDSLKNSVPTKFKDLPILGAFITLLTYLKGISIQGSIYTRKYLSLNGDSFNNKKLKK